MKLPLFIRRSLTARLALVYGLVGALLVPAMGLSVYFFTAGYLHDQAKDDLASLADFYAAYAAAAAPDEARLKALAPQISSFFATQADYDVRFFGTRSGALLAATRDITSLPSNAALAELSSHWPLLFLTRAQDQPERLYTARTVVAADGTALAVVEVSRDVGDVESFLAALRLILIGTGALTLIAGLAASLLLARQVTRPFHQIESATRAIAAGDFGRSPLHTSGEGTRGLAPDGARGLAPDDARGLATTRDDEIGHLAKSISQMAADLARLEAARREFIARVSHDLRTPLTAIKGLIVNLQDVAPQEMIASLQTMDEQTDRLIRLVNDLLTLSRLQRGELHLRLAETDLGKVASSVVSLAKEKARRLGVALAFDLPERPALVRADADRLQQVVVNLVDNALRAAPPGGSVDVSVSPAQDRVTLTVRDDGPGLTAEEEQRAFEPYFHGPGGGAGLGLAIAREIVTAHSGQIWLRSRPEGDTEAGLSLPAAAASATGNDGMPKIV